MITRRQWNEFCFNIRQLKYAGYQLFINGKRILNVDSHDVIHCGKRGEGETIYTFKDSLKNVSSLWQLQSDVYIGSPISLRSFKRVYCMMKKGRIYDCNEEEDLV